MSERLPFFENVKIENIMVCIPSKNRIRNDRKIDTNGCGRIRRKISTVLKVEKYKYFYIQNYYGKEFLPILV